MNKLIRIPLFIAAFVALGLMFGYITFNILSFSRTVEVPQLSGMTLLEANEALTRAGLYLKIEGEDYDPAAPPGRIIRQDVPSANKVKEKRVIKVVVSKGPRFFSIPLLVNETVSDADALLIQKGLRIGRRLTVHSDTVEKGRIVAQRPEPDEKITDTITVLVSAGPHELSYFCPDFINRPLDDARELAKKMGLTVETKGQGSLVAAQKPKAGARVQGGETIYFEMKEGDAND